jgi:hypothetical protein
MWISSSHWFPLYLSELWPRNCSIDFKCEMKYKRVNASPSSIRNKGSLLEFLLNLESLVLRYLCRIFTGHKAELLRNRWISTPSLNGSVLEDLRCNTALSSTNRISSRQRLHSVSNSIFTVNSPHLKVQQIMDRSLAKSVASIHTNHFHY